MATVLDKLNLSVDKVEAAMKEALRPRSDLLSSQQVFSYATAARRLSAMLQDSPAPPSMTFSYILKLATKDSKFFSLQTARHQNVVQFLSIDILSLPLFILLLFSNK